MSRFSITLPLEDVAEARRAAKKRGDAGPGGAIGEKVVSVACRRKWEGAFQKLEKWDTWKRVGKVPSSIEVRLVHSSIVDLEVVDLTADDHVIVLVNDSEAQRYADAQRFVIVGWAFAGDVQKEKYWREHERKFVMPHAALRSPWDLKRERRGRGKRLNANDPADDFAGHGKFPGMLDTDDGRPPQKYGNVVRSPFELPCRRCQTMIPAGDLSTWHPHTGTIHGDPDECKFKADKDDE